MDDTNAMCDLRSHTGTRARVSSAARATAGHVEGVRGDASCEECSSYLEAIVLGDIAAGVGAAPISWGCLRKIFSAARNT
jgi:hypothetical protein